MWPYTPLTTYVASSTPSIKASDLNAFQAQINVLSNWKDNPRLVWYSPRDFLNETGWNLSGVGGTLTTTSTTARAYLWLDRFFAKTSSVREKITKIELGYNVAVGNSGGNKPVWELYSYDALTTAPASNLVATANPTISVGSFQFYTLFSSVSYGNSDTSALYLKFTGGLSATGDILYGVRVTYDETLY